VKDFVGDLRREHINQLLDEFRVEGVVALRQKFCDPHVTDQAKLADLFSQRGIPTLSLELDFTTPLGQYRTRVEAFLEMMALEEVG
jgi:benzoyl-CoA reductase subunit C